jgi:hypothetical protein
MKDKILKLVAKGDYHLKEAKSRFWIRQKEVQGHATCECCKALVKYLKAYEHYLFPALRSSNNIHLLLRKILERDHDFQQFYEKVFEVKCFAEESKNEKENFFIYDDEMNNAITIALSIREYISMKVHFEKQFMSEYIDTSFMST